MLYLDVAAIPFKVVTLCNDTPFPAFLPCLECLLIVLLFRRVKYHLRIALELLHGVKTPALPAEALSLGRGRSRMEPNLASRVGVERRPCWCGPNTRVFLTYCEPVRCHVGALNSHHATVQDVCAEFSLLDASERCSRTRHRQSDPS